MKSVDASSISAEKLEGAVMLSGFAKNTNEKTMVETKGNAMNRDRIEGNWTQVKTREARADDMWFQG